MLLMWSLFMNNIRRTHQKFCDYILAFKGLTPRTIKGYKEVFRYFITASPVNEVKEVTQFMIEDWLMNGKLEKEWSAKTIRNRLLALRSFFKWCKERGLIDKDPTEFIPKPKLPKSLPKSLSLKDAEKLLDWTKHMKYYYKSEKNRAVAIISTFLYTGIRLDELYNLKFHDIDLEHKVLTVISGKGQKDRKIPLNNSLISLLEKYVKDRNKRNVHCPYFFVSLRADDKMSRNVVKRLVIKLRERTGIYFYPHMLRHTFATLMLEGGCNLYTLSKLMGHSDVKTTTINLATTTSHLYEEICKHPLY